MLFMNKKYALQYIYQIVRGFIAWPLSVMHLTEPMQESLTSTQTESDTTSLSSVW